MKTKVVILISIGILLASCAPATSTPQLVTNIPVSTTIPTNVPTTTLTPIATLDPNVPVGTRGQDAQGEFVTTENGVIARKVEYKSASGEILWSGWAVEKTQAGGIALLDSGPYKVVPVKLLFASDVVGGEALISLTSPADPDGGHDSLMSAVYTALLERKNISMSDNNGSRDFWDKLGKGELSLPFTTSKGTSTEVFLGSDTGFTTIVVPYTLLVPAEGNGVSEWVDVRSGIRFRSILIGVDSAGNAIGLIASEKPLNELPDSAVRLLTLFHSASIIAVESQEVQGYSVTLDLFVQYADKKGNKTVPDIIITRRP